MSISHEKLRALRELHPWWNDAHLIALDELRGLVLEAIDAKRREGHAREPLVSALRALWGERAVEELDRIVGEGTWEQ